MTALQQLDIQLPKMFIPLSWNAFSEKNLPKINVFNDTQGFFESQLNRIVLTTLPIRAHSYQYIYRQKRQKLFRLSVDLHIKWTLLHYLGIWFQKRPINFRRNMHFRRAFHFTFMSASRQNILISKYLKYSTVSNFYEDLSNGAKCYEVCVQIKIFKIKWTWKILSKHRCLQDFNKTLNHVEYKIFGQQYASCVNRKERNGVLLC